jgi:hypothetical protein
MNLRTFEQYKSALRVFVNFGVKRGGVKGVPQPRSRPKMGACFSGLDRLTLPQAGTLVSLRLIGGFVGLAFLGWGMKKGG